MIQFWKVHCIKELLLKAKKLFVHLAVHSYKDVSHSCCDRIWVKKILVFSMVVFGVYFLLQCVGMIFFSESKYMCYSWGVWGTWLCSCRFIFIWNCTAVCSINLSRSRDADMSRQGQIKSISRKDKWNLSLLSCPCQQLFQVNICTLIQIILMIYT